MQLVEIYEIFSEGNILPWVLQTFLDSPSTLNKSLLTRV